MSIQHELHVTLMLAIAYKYVVSEWIYISVEITRERIVNIPSRGRNDQNFKYLLSFPRRLER